MSGAKLGGGPKGLAPIFLRDEVGAWDLRPGAGFAPGFRLLYVEGTLYRLSDVTLVSSGMRKGARLEGYEVILARASKICVVAGLMVSAASVRADVMQIDSEGARWVAGPMANQQADNPTLKNGAIDLDAIVVPDSIVADTRRHASSIPVAYTAKVNELAARFDLSPSLIEAVVWQESRWREDAVSHAGARGLAQLMPGTAKYLGVDPDDPMANLEGGARYLREQLDRFDGDLEKALAAYNAGPGRVERAGGIPNIRETKQYVAAIMGRLAGHSRPME